MNAALNAARACAALLAIGLSCSAAIAMAPDNAGPQIMLVSTDTSEPYPFAEIVVNDKSYHVTEGDVIVGLHVVHITPGHLTLSNDDVLLPLQPVTLNSVSQPAREKSLAKR